MSSGAAGGSLSGLLSGWSARLLAHLVPLGPQGPEAEAAGGCLVSGPASGTGTGSGSSSQAAVMHLHGKEGGHIGLATDWSRPVCVPSEGEFFDRDLWVLIVALCTAGAALLFVLAVAKAAGLLLRGQGAGVGQAVKSVVPLLLMAAVLAGVATLPILVLPLVQAVMSLFLHAVDSLVN